MVYFHKELLIEMELLNFNTIRYDILERQLSFDQEIKITKMVVSGPFKKKNIYIYRTFGIHN